jgi:hypothetical protein
MISRALPRRREWSPDLHDDEPVSFHLNTTVIEVWAIAGMSLHELLRITFHVTTAPSGRREDLDPLEAPAVCRTVTPARTQ